jgi:voltage-gated potassium channel
MAAIGVSVLLLTGMAAAAAATDRAIWTESADWLRLAMVAAHLALAAQMLHTLRKARAEPRGIARYLRSFEGAIDAISLCAVPVLLLGGVHEPIAWLACLVWTLKFVSASHAFPLVARVIVVEARLLAGVGALFCIILAGSATALFLLERKLQPDTFGTLPKGLWWAVTTLTTTGYGDAVPHTALGRFIAGCVMMSGLGIFGLFTGVLATGFAAEGRRANFLKAWDLIEHVPFFHGLSAAATAQLARSLRRIDVPVGSVIVRRGRMGDCMYFVVEGEVKVDLPSGAVRQGPGSFFGEVALLGSGIRSATVTATRPATLLMLDIADFRLLAANHPEIAEAVETEARRRAMPGVMQEGFA